MKLRKAIKYILFPALLLSMLLSSSSTLFLLFQNTLLGNQLEFSQIHMLKVSSIVPSILLILLLLLFSKRKPFEKVFKGTLITLIGAISLLTVLMFFQKHLEWTNAPESLGMYKPLVVHWPASLMDIVLTLLSFNLFLLLIWGFINRLTSPSEGIKYYIPLAIVFAFTGSGITRLGFSLVKASSSPLLSMMIPAIVLMACALMIFNWSWKRLPDSLIHPEQSSSTPQTRFPYLSGAYLLAGCVMVLSLLIFLFPSQGIQPPNLSSFSKSFGSTTMILSIVLAVFGTLIIVKKGWKTTALYASLTILLGGILFIGIPTSESTTWLRQGTFAGLLTSTSSVIFFPLIQILYLYLPYQTRFKTKIATEMIAMPLMQSSVLMVLQGLIIALGSISAIALYLKILIPVLMLLLVVASRRAGARFSGSTT